MSQKSDAEGHNDYQHDNDNTMMWEYDNYGILMRDNDYDGHWFNDNSNFFLLFMTHFYYLNIMSFLAPTSATTTITSQRCGRITMTGRVQ